MTLNTNSCNGAENLGFLLLRNTFLGTLAICALGALLVFIGQGKHTHLLCGFFLSFFGGGDWGLLHER